MKQKFAQNSDLAQNRMFQLIFNARRYATPHDYLSPSVCVCYVFLSQAGVVSEGWTMTYRVDFGTYRLLSSFTRAMLCYKEVPRFHRSEARYANRHAIQYMGRWRNYVFNLSVRLCVRRRSPTGLRWTSSFYSVMNYAHICGF